MSNTEPIEQQVPATCQDQARRKAVRLTPQPDVTVEEDEQVQSMYETDS